MLVANRQFRSTQSNKSDGPIIFIYIIFQYNLKMKREVRAKMQKFYSILLGFHF